ncbi:hypothetical protein EJ04DRAFT_577587 [Polyplosphaeria fusca]|uniref:Small ribosomal subunit protein uS10m n=1 Tax=Polyplosphaeria fusca TaxID=682080 RepID=A0A9P4QYP1_9PLEO|nr:hypothetical protein EJ04DRAFT_577587 [Polyplosphaeria fusca]
MAVPRCTRSFLGPTKRLNISHPRPSIQTFSRAKSSRSDDDAKAVGSFAAQEGIKFDENLSLDERLQELGADPAEYKKLLASYKQIERRQRAEEPQTAKETAKQWKEWQKTPEHNVMLHMYKRAGVEPIKVAKERKIQLPGGEKASLDAETQKQLNALRTPLNVKAIGLRPLRRSPEHGVRVCDLQLRTYSIRNMEFFADFAMRAAYYMGLPARGPIPLPRITERWTVPRANFIFKKSQENFERITMRRLIQIQDGHPDVVKAWIAFLQKHQYHGVGMKTNIWEYESLEQATSVGESVKPGEFKGRREGPMLEKVREILSREGYQKAMKEHKTPTENML